MKNRLTGRARSSRRAGGKTLLYEAAYPEVLYRWQQARFGLEAALGKARGRISPRVVESIGKAADRFHVRVATPMLVGKKPPARAAP